MATYQLIFKTHRNAPYPTVRFEWFSRGTEPVMILRPNLDVDGRKLPSQPPSPAIGAQLQGAHAKLLRDFELHPKSKTDDELVYLQILREGAHEGAQPRVQLRLPDHARQGLRIADAATNVVLLADPNDENRWTLPHIEGDTRLTLEVISLLGIVPESNQAEGVIKTTSINPFPFRIELLVDGQVADTKAAMIAPLLLPSTDFEVERLLVSALREEAGSRHMHDNNVSTLIDLQRALSHKGADFILQAGQDMHHDDMRMQDQFQMGYCNSPQGSSLIAVHLPRLSGSGQCASAVANLAQFVETILPSSQIGIYNGLRTKIWEAVGINDAKAQLNLRQAGQIRAIFAQFGTLYLRFAQLIQSKIPALKLESQPIMQIFQLHDLRNCVARMLAEQTDLQAGLCAQLRQDILDADVLFTYLHSDPDDPTKTTFRFSVPDVIDLKLDRKQLQCLLNKLEIAFGTQNFGGNIAVSPPVKGAPLGKIVVGTDDHPTRRLSPNLEKLLEAQSWQPLVKIHTAWLSVGHVDELLAFAPYPKHPCQTAMFQASPSVALHLLQGAADRFAAGGGAETCSTAPARQCPATMRHTWVGTHPVTQMLRGKCWRLSNLSTWQAGDTILADPTIPKILQRIHALQIEADSVDAQAAACRNGQGQDYCHAGVTITAVLACAAHGNAMVAQNALRCNDEVLKLAFPEVPIMHLPVLFDLVLTPADSTEFQAQPSDDPQAAWPTQVDAFLPNMVNMQIVGHQLLVPRPYGPRMQPEDAAYIVNETLTVFLPEADPEITTGLIAKHRLADLRCWLEAPISASIGGNDSDLARIAAMFQDTFLNQADAELKIRKANAGKFTTDGDLTQTGIQEISIPEDTVDLFELYMQVVAAHMGLRLSWIDTWYYHVRKGGLHSGTNSIPKLSSKLPAWWKMWPHQR